MRSLRAVATLSSLAVILAAGVAYAWTGPTQSAPNGNTPAPLNVSGTDQTKAGGLTLPWLSLAGGTYLTFGTTGGVNGYGMRDNGGTIEFKNSGGSWQSIQSMIYNLGGGLWTQNGSSLYYNGGAVGIGTASPKQKLDINDGALTFHSDTGGINWGSDSTGSGITGDGSKLYFISGNSVREAIDSSGNVGIDTATPRAALEVNGHIMNTTAYNNNTNLSGYDVGVGTIGAGTSIYSYGSLCTSNSSGTCNGSSGVVIGGTNTSATVNIPSSGTTFFNGGNVGVGTVSPNSKFNVVNGTSGQWGAYVTSPSYGIYGSAASYGVYGNSTAGGYGVYGYAAQSGGVGVRGDGSAYGGQFYNTASGATVELAYGSYALYTGNNVYANNYYSSAIGTWMSNLRISQQLGGGWYTASNSCGSSAVMYAINYGSTSGCTSTDPKTGSCTGTVTSSYIAGVYCRSFIY